MLRIPSESRLVFVFPMRSFNFCSGKGQKEYEIETVFRRTLERCDSEVRKHLGWSIFEVFQKKNDASFVPENFFEPVLTARQIAFAELLKSWGIKPSAVMGYCGGEFAAGYAAGVLSLESAMELACRVSKLIAGQKVPGKGLIVHCTLRVAEELRLLAPVPFFVGAHLTRDLIFVCCEPKFLQTIQVFFNARGIHHELTPTGFAYHSPLTDGWQSEIVKPLQNGPGSLMVPIYSAMTGGRIDHGMFDTAHWWDVIRKPILGFAAVHNLVGDGYRTFLHIGYSPFLSSTLRQIAEEIGEKMNDIPMISGDGETKKSRQAGRSLNKIFARVGGKLFGLRDFCAKRFIPGGKKERPEIYLFSDEFSRNPYPHYRKLRERFPVFYNEKSSSWIVSRYEHVVQVLKSPQLFSSAPAKPRIRSLINMDPPDHTRMRRIISEYFSEKRITHLTERIHYYTNTAIERIRKKPKFDLVQEFAAPLPVYIVCELMGLDTKHLDQYQRWSKAWGLELSSDSELHRQAVREFYDFIACFVEKCKAGSGQGMIYDLVREDQGKEKLGQDEVVEFAKLLMLAGTVTTANLIGNAIRALLQHPEELKLLRENPDLIPGTIEETLRYESPAPFLTRFALKDAQFEGAHIAAGDRVDVLLASANRDERQFSDPDAFRIQRNPQGHIAFGIGHHFCLGARLSRLEAKIALEALIFHLPPFRSTGPLDQVNFLKTRLVRGLEEFEVTFDSN